MKISEKTCVEFVNLLASKSAVPGGGGLLPYQGPAGLPRDRKYLRELGLHLYAQSGGGGPADFSQAAQHQPPPALLCDPFQRG